MNTSTTRTRKPKQMKGVRLEEAVIAKLNDVAYQRNMTISDVIGEFVAQGLAAEKAKASLVETLVAIRIQQKQIRRDLTLMAEALLCAAGKFPQKEAEAWAKEVIGAD